MLALTLSGAAHPALRGGDAAEAARVGYRLPDTHLRNMTRHEYGISSFTPSASPQISRDRPYKDGEEPSGACAPPRGAAGGDEPPACVSASGEAANINPSFTVPTPTISASGYSSCHQHTSCHVARRGCFQAPFPLRFLDA